MQSSRIYSRKNEITFISSDFTLHVKEMYFHEMFGTIWSRIKLKRVIRCVI